jgi:hypothetical protein
MKHEEARDNKILVTHPMTDQRNFRDRTPKRTDTVLTCNSLSHLYLLEKPFQISQF